MRKKQARRLFSFMFACVLAVGSLAGCGKEGSGIGTGNGAGSGSGTGNENGNAEEARGRYVEQEVAVPFAEDEQALCLIRTQAGNYKIYTYLSGEKTYRAYESADGENFTEGTADWLNQTLGGADCYIESIFQGADGKDYVLYYQDSQDHLICSGDGSSHEEVFAETLQDKIGVEMAGILENGDLVISDSVTGKLEVWDAQNGSRKQEMEQGTSSATGLRMFDCRNGKAIVLNREGSGFTVYDTATGEAVQEFSYQELGTGDTYGILKLGENEDCFYLERKGLHHIGSGASTVERLIEGDTVSMGDSTMQLVDMALGAENDYFVLYNQENKKGMLAHYVYDSDAKVTPDNQLVIFGMEENKTIKQAVSRFQKDHPEVRVIYKTGSQQETGATRADQIRVLNTELLGGNGADILALDGLPLDSYIEKGVLMDLSGFYQEIQQDSPLPDNIVESMKKSGGLYQLPVRFKVLSIYGTEEEVAAMQSLDSLSAYLDANGGEDLLSANSFEAYLRLLMTLNYKELFLGGGAISETELTKLLETAKKFGDATGTEDGTIIEHYVNGNPELTEETVLKEFGAENLYSVDTNNDLRARKGSQAVVIEAGGAMSLIMACTVLQETGLSPQGIHGLYLPKGMVGVNAGSSQKELAQEFLKFLFSEEIQSLDLNDGFPINERSLEEWCQKEAPADGMGLAIVGTSNEDGEMFSATEPVGAQIQPFAQFGREADTPVMIDDILLEVILDEGIAYCKGEKSLEEAVSSITGKVRTYLSE